MAKIKIESARVTRAIGSNGAFIVEEYKTLPDGRSFPIKYTIWHKGTAPDVDTIVNITGELGVKVTDPNEAGKVYANISVNDPVVNVMGTQSENAAKLNDLVNGLGNSLADEKRDVRRVVDSSTGQTSYVADTPF